MLGPLFDGLLQQSRVVGQARRVVVVQELEVVSLKAVFLVLLLAPFFRAQQLRVPHVVV